jgi:Protein of unknown function (DUF2752)
MTTFDAPPPPRTTGVAWFLNSPIRVAGLAAAAVLVIDAGGTDNGAGLCIFRRCTGGYCPGCGMTRSARHLTRGEFTAAWHDHPWLVLAAGQAIIAAVLWGLLRHLGRSFHTQRLVISVAVLNVVLVVGIWITRLVDGSIPRFY